MRFSTVVAALPVLVAAQQSPLDQVRALAQPYLAPVQQYIEKIQKFIPNPHSYDPVAAAAAKAAGANIDYIGSSNWESTLRPAGKSYAKGTEEWWVLITGGNKTCYGYCGQVDKAYNETAALFAVDPSAPHLAVLNCDQSPVLCHSWSASPAALWIFDIGAPGTKTDLHKVRLNTTSTDVQTFQDIKSKKEYKSEAPAEGYFHPFDGQLRQLGLATPAGYILWVFSVVPSWLMMISISFASRQFM